MKLTPFRQGFTLIELSIALVIIGLIAGGVLFGRDLIRAAELRALITQVNQFKIATNTFKNKYGQLPGDMQTTKAAQFGLFTFSNNSGNALVNAAWGFAAGNNDGIIHRHAPGRIVEALCEGEETIFWRHLAQAKLINLSTDVPLISAPTNLGMNARWASGVPFGSKPGIDPLNVTTYLPTAKAFNAYFCASTLRDSFFFQHMNWLNVQDNVFILSGPENPDRDSALEPSLSPVDLYGIDLKIDDGMPNKGKVLNNPYIDPPLYYYWSATRIDGVCTYGGTSEQDATVQYNADPTPTGISNPYDGGWKTNITCQPVFVW